VNEILPGVFHWTAEHPKIKVRVSSYWLRDERVVLDPMVPEEGLDRFDLAPQHVVLTNRHHYRDSGRFAERFGCTVWCVETGMHEFSHGEAVEPFRFGATLAGSIEAIEIGELCPDETALYIPKPGGVVAVADGVIRYDSGPLAFVPDAYLGDDPAAIKRGLKASYRRLLDREFDHLLLAHGSPWIGGGRDALREFVES